MAAIMTKQGSSDNQLTYEFMCDELEDLAKIDPKYITIGSVAVVINGFEVFIANSKKQWVGLNATSDEDGE